MTRKRETEIGFFFNRSILWKIIIVYGLILLLLIFQFFIIFNTLLVLNSNSSDSFSKISSQSDDSYVSVDTEFISTFSQLDLIENDANIQRNITKSISTLNDQILSAQTIYTRYVAGITGSTFINDILFTTSINEEVENLESLVASVTNEDLTPRVGVIFSSIISEEIVNYIELGQNISKSLPSLVNLNIISSFTNFSNVVNFKFSNLIQWMYSSNDTEQLDFVQLENNSQSSFANKLNISLFDVKQPNNVLYQQLLSLSAEINAEYVSLNTPIQTIINEVDSSNFNPSNYDQALLKLNIDLVSTIVANINNITSTVAEIMNSQELILDQLIEDVNDSFIILTPALDDLFTWSEQASNILSENIKLLQINARVNLNNITETSSSLISEVILSSKIFISSQIDSTTGLLLLLLLLSVLVVVSFIVLAHFQISKPIKHISYWSVKISDGDLSYNDYKSARVDEIGILHNNFRTMNKNLKDIIVEVQDSSTVISNTADDLSTNTEQINATTEEVSAIAQSMAKGSTQQAELISTIVEELQITSEIVDGVISQINYNLRIIHELSEQTNVLALNTAIEAANAGEFGRGFSVISESIRKMASQSKKTTEEVTKDSREVLLQLQTTFTNITGKIENIAAVSEETAASAEEVAASAEELTAVMQTVSAKSAMLNRRSSQSASLVSHFILKRQDERDVNLKSDSNEKNNTQSNGSNNNPESDNESDK